MVHMLGNHINKVENQIIGSEDDRRPDQVVHPHTLIAPDIRPPEWLNPRLLPDLQAEQNHLVSQYRETNPIEESEEGVLATQCAAHGDMCRSLAESFRKNREAMNQSLPRTAPPLKTVSPHAATLTSLLRAMTHGEALIDSATQQSIRVQQQEMLLQQYQQLHPTKPMVLNQNPGASVNPSGASAIAAPMASAAATGAIQSNAQNISSTSTSTSTLNAPGGIAAPSQATRLVPTLGSLPGNNLSNAATSSVPLALGGSMAQPISGMATTKPSAPPATAGRAPAATGVPKAGVATQTAQQRAATARQAQLQQQQQAQYAQQQAANAGAQSEYSGTAVTMRQVSFGPAPINPAAGRTVGYAPAVEAMQMQQGQGANLPPHTYTQTQTQPPGKR